MSRSCRHPEYIPHAVRCHCLINSMQLPTSTACKSQCLCVCCWLAPAPHYLATTVLFTYHPSYPLSNEIHFVPFFSHPRSEGWPQHGHTISIYLSPLSFWLTLPWTVLSTSWCCPSRPCVVFLACVNLPLFLALSLSPGNSLVFWWCDHSMLASLLLRYLTVPSLLQHC